MFTPAQTGRILHLWSGSRHGSLRIWTHASYLWTRTSVSVHTHTKHTHGNIWLNIVSYFAQLRRRHSYGDGYFASVCVFTGCAQGWQHMSINTFPFVVPTHCEHIQPCLGVGVSFLCLHPHLAICGCVYFASGYTHTRHTHSEIHSDGQLAFRVSLHYVRRWQSVFIYMCVSFLCTRAGRTRLAIDGHMCFISWYIFAKYTLGNIWGYMYLVSVATSATYTSRNHLFRCVHALHSRLAIYAGLSDSEFNCVTVLTDKIEVYL